MEQTYDQTRLDALIGRIFVIEDITVGTPEKDFILRYRGRLRSEDSEKAYNELSELLRPNNITPLFRLENKRQIILLVPSKPKPRPSNPWVNVIMFILTALTVTFVGADRAGLSLPADPLGFILGIFRSGWPYTVSLLSILLAHEFGHYLMSRHYGVNATLPYFIPFPSVLGTMGAVIMMKEQPKNRLQLLDIGLAGPFAGLLVAIPVLILGLALSTPDRLPTQAPSGMMILMEGNSIIYLLMKYLMFGQLLPAPASYVIPVWLYWLRYFFTAQPTPLGGMDVSLHSVAFAGWAGLLVTALNLIPAGQLDGGHAVYVLIGRERARKLLPFILAIIAVLGIFYYGWWLWFVLIFFFGRAYDDPLDQITPIGPGRRALAILAIIIFFLVFTPIPMSLIGG